jgi:phage shock protein C
MQLRRSNEHRMIAGVAGGLAESFNIDPTWFRVGFVLFTIFGGAGTLLYALLWIVIPRADGGTIADEGMQRAKRWYEDRNRPKPPHAG